MTPPCGVPSSGSVIRPSSMIPAFSAWIESPEPKAIEVELTQKSRRRYETIFDAYRRRPRTAAVLYLTGWPGGAAMILKNAREQRAPFVYACALDEFRRTAGRCVFRGAVEGRCDASLKLLAVTALTSYDDGDLRDAEKKKMSKSKGNVINPLDVTQTYGTDALRMALLVGNTPGQDTALAENKIKAYKLFANKIWNIARFVLSRERNGEINLEIKEEFNALAKDVTEDIEHYRVYLAAEKLYHYVWDRFAAQIIEDSKGKPEYGETLYYILENSLKLLHPFMPFVTEEIWSSFAKASEDKRLLMIESWPIL